VNVFIKQRSRPKKSSKEAVRRVALKDKDAAVMVCQFSTRSSWLSCHKGRKTVWYCFGTLWFGISRKVFCRSWN